MAHLKKSKKKSITSEDIFLVTPLQQSSSKYHSPPLVAFIKSESFIVYVYIRNNIMYAKSVTDM